MLEVKRIQPEMTYHLRQTVLRPEQPIEESMYESDYDESTFHVGAFYQGKLISVVTFIVEKLPDCPFEKQYRLRQMATLEEYRKLGAGKAVVNFAENMVKEFGVNFIWCKGRTNVQAYYERLGFKAHGEVFDYPPIGLHILMCKELS